MSSGSDGDGGIDGGPGPGAGSSPIGSLSSDSDPSSDSDSSDIASPDDGGEMDGLQDALELSEQALPDDGGEMDGFQDALELSEQALPDGDAEDVSAFKSDVVSPADKDADDVSAVQVKKQQIHQRIEDMALKEGWPDAPDTLLGLYEWPVRYASKLLSHPTMGRRRAEQIFKMGNLGMQINEQFAGTGNGGVCAHQAYTALRQEAFRVLGTAAEEVVGQSAVAVPSHSGLAAGSNLKTMVSGDINPECRNFLAGLYEEARPRCVQDDCLHRLTSACRQRLETIRDNVVYELEQVLGSGDDDEAARWQRIYGKKLFDAYVACLKQDPGHYVDAVPCDCHMDDPDSATAECLTPVGFARRQGRLVTGPAIPARPLYTERSDKDPFRMSVAGTTCTDFSIIGKRQALLGDSALPLAAWICERYHAREEVIVHECTTMFSKELLSSTLPEYQWHWLSCKSDEVGSETESLDLNPALFGWPMTRPRAYSVGLLRDSCHFDTAAGRGIHALRELFQKPTAHVHDLFAAPQAMVEQERRALAKKHFMRKDSRFIDLLRGTARAWADGYRNVKKVKQNFAAGRPSMVANLLQNPASFPLCNVYLPTLLRRGEMFLLSNRDDIEERVMLTEEHLLAMGVPSFPGYSNEKTCDRFPRSTHMQCCARSTLKSMSGNAMQSAVIGAIWATVFAEIVLSPADPELVRVKRSARTMVVTVD